MVAGDWRLKRGITANGYEGSFKNDKKCSKILL